LVSGNGKVGIGKSGSEILLI